MVNYGKELLSMFSYEFKDTDMSHQQDRTSTKTLDQEGNLAVCGYLCHPSSDKFQMKPSYFTNGKKDRGKIIPTQDAELLFETLTRPEQMTREHVDHILAGVTKTLRLIVSLASRPLDTLGLCNCLISQIRHTVSLAMGLAQGDWSFKVPEELWTFFLEQLLEVCKVSLFKFDRFPPKATSLEGQATLLALVDASNSLVIHVFLINPTEDGGKAVSLLTHKAHLATTVTSIPKRELQAKVLGAQIC